MTAQPWPVVLAEMEAETVGERPVVIGDAPWLYDAADFPGFTPEQIVAGLTVPACGEVE